MALRENTDDPGDRRGRVHRLARRPDAAGRRLPGSADAQATVLDKLTYAGNMANRSW
ncbi:MAG TPA: hypothetical protein VIL16_16790 [Trebonia sp.]